MLLSYKWNSDNRAEFLNNIRSEQYQNQLQLINNDRKGARVTVDIDKNLDQFNDILHGVCKPLFKKNVRKNSNKDAIKKRNSWYVDECKCSKRTFNNNLNNLVK